MPELIWKDFIVLDLVDALQVVLLGFIGGTLSGFMGSGGAFFMTPGMMNLGVPGVIAVGSNITHKFGKAMMGARQHGELGNVDRKLGIFLVLTAFAGIRLAVWINSYLFRLGETVGEDKAAAANLYISVVFVGILAFVALSMLRDVTRTSDEEGGPSRKIADALARLRLFPLMHFPVADVRVSLWVLMIVGLATGYLAGTIGVGGFVGVPAMIYVFGVPTAVAAGTELFLAMFMGAFGALNYVWAGFVDIRLTMLLYPCGDRSRHPHLRGLAGHRDPHLSPSARLHRHRPGLGRVAQPGEQGPPHACRGRGRGRHPLQRHRCLPTPEPDPPEPGRRGRRPGPTVEDARGRAGVATLGMGRPASGDRLAERPPQAPRAALRSADGEPRRARRAV
jgi:uncharacterized membrane protein YfcA